MDRSRIISLVNTELYDRVQEMARLALQRGVDLHFYCGIRPARTQAQYYRRGRSLAQIEAKARSLEKKGFPGLAQLLLDVGQQPDKGGMITLAAPGESWHQYGEAVDGVPVHYAGKKMVCEWDPRRYARKWHIYGAAARKADLHWAGEWERFREYPHVQMREGGNPLHVMDDFEVRTILRGQGVDT